uniref:FLYWCH-type domain-containing protein n=1 Tax=Ditylenchus dipsaci TaxID=166011 RepID=A0A915E0H0_9BILA
MQNNKGKPAVLCNGFVMCKAKKSADGLRQYWRCTLEKSGCLGRAISSVGSMVLKQTVPHNIHAPSPIDVKKRQTMTAMKEAAKTNLAISTAQILATAKSSLSEIEIESFGKDVNWKKTITNARKPMRGADVDKPLVEMTLNGEYVLTKSELPVILIFASDRGLDLLRLYRNWSIDGTFFCCPKNFAQLFTINVFKGASTLPAVFLLLPDKKEVTYKRAFDALFDRIPMVFCESVMSESLSNLQQKGLVDLYQILAVKVLLRSFNALAFLPHNEVAVGFDQVESCLEEKITNGIIPENKSEALREYLAYIKRTYLKEEENATWQMVVRNTARPADPLRNPRSTKAVNSELQIFKLVNDYSEVPFDLRERVPFLRRIQYQLANFYTAIPAEVVQVDEVPEEVHVNEEQVLEEVNPNYYFDATLNIYRRSS